MICFLRSLEKLVLMICLNNLRKKDNLNVQKLPERVILEIQINNKLVVPLLQKQFIQMVKWFHNP